MSLSLLVGTTVTVESPTIIPIKIALQAVVMYERCNPFALVR